MLKLLTRLKQFSQTQAAFAHTQLWNRLHNRDSGGGDDVQYLDPLVIILKPEHIRYPEGKEIFDRAAQHFLYSINRQNMWTSAYTSSTGTLDSKPSGYETTSHLCYTSSVALNNKNGNNASVGILVKVPAAADRVMLTLASIGGAQSYENNINGPNMEIYPGDATYCDGVCNAKSRYRATQIACRSGYRYLYWEGLNSAVKFYPQDTYKLVCYFESDEAREAINGMSASMMIWGDGDTSTHYGTYVCYPTIPTPEKNGIGGGGTVIIGG